MFKKILFLSCLSASLLSCSTKENGKSSGTTDQVPAPPSGLSYQVLADNSPKGIRISDIKIDTTKAYEGAKGLIVSFNVQTNKEALEILKKEDYTSYFIDLKCTTTEGKSCLYRNDLFKSPDKIKFIHINRDCFISQPTVRHIEIALPYRELEMKEGNQELTMQIDAYPAKFLDDSTSLSMRMLKGIGEISKGYISLKTSVSAPELYKASFTVYKAKIDTRLVNPAKYDFAVTGSGFPDLFWEVYCGNDYLYNSPVEKNQIEYTDKYSSPSFYCSPDDIINLGMADYDKGPFNRQSDVVGVWQVKASDLKSDKMDTLRFGKLEYMIIQAKVERGL